MAGSHRNIIALGTMIGLVLLSALPMFGRAQNRAEYFQSVVSGELRAPLLSGPHGLPLEQSANVLMVYKAGLDVADFVAHAAFTNPLVEDETGWDYGFQFRTTGNNEDLRLFVTSAGDWNFSIGIEPPEQTVVAPSLDLTPGAVNTLDLIVDDFQALFGINGQYVGITVLPEIRPSGDVFASTGFLGNLVVPGRIVELSDFSVYAIPDSRQFEAATPPESAATARPVSLINGTCDEPGAVAEALLEASLPLGERQGSARAVIAETSFTRISLTVSELMNAPFAVTIAESFDNPATTIACADIGGIPDEIGGYVMTVSERENSGYSGIIYLAEEADSGEANISVFVAQMRPVAGVTASGVRATPSAAGTPVSVIELEDVPPGVRETGATATPTS